MMRIRYGYARRSTCTELHNYQCLTPRMKLTEEDCKRVRKFARKQNGIYRVSPGGWVSKEP